MVDRLSNVLARVRRVASSDAVLTLLLAVAYFQLVWGFKIVNPRNVQWLYDNENDLILYLTTNAHFRFSAWSFPITRFDTLLYPTGTSIAVADGLPLLAVPFKLLDPVLPGGLIQYFGAWLFACVWVQAFLCKKIFSGLGVSVPLQWVGTAMMTADLPQAFAIWHMTLWAHFIFLYGFYVVLRPKLELRHVCALLALAPWIAAYLYVMVLATCTALFIKHWRSPGILKKLAIASAVTLFSCFMVGYFHFKTGEAAEGEYMADLTTFINSGGIGRLGPKLSELRNYDEGFGYLGLGGIALLAVLLVEPLLPRSRQRSVHAPLLLAVCVLMALYAVGPNPLFRGRHLGEIEWLHEAISPITHRLRATGRFVWPLWHYIMLFGIRALHELIRDRRYAIGAGFAVLALQIADVGPWLANPWRPAPDHAQVRPVPEEVASQLTPRSRFLIFSPKLICKQGPKKRRGMWGLAMFGAANRLATNSEYGALARLSSEDTDPVCRVTKELWRHREQHPEVIFVREGLR